MLMTAMDAHMHKVSLYVQVKLLHICVYGPQTYMFALIMWVYLCFRQWRRVINGAGSLWRAAGPFSEISQQSAVLTTPLPQRSVITPIFFL